MLLWLRDPKQVQSSPIRTSSNALGVRKGDMWDVELPFHLYGLVSRLLAESGTTWMSWRLILWSRIGSRCVLKARLHVPVEFGCIRGHWWIVRVHLDISLSVQSDQPSRLQLCNNNQSCYCGVVRNVLVRNSVVMTFSTECSCSSKYGITSETSTQTLSASVLNYWHA